MASWGRRRALCCGRKKGKGFPGYALVANAGERTVAAVDLTVFAVARQIGLEAAAGAVIAHPVRPAAYVLMPESGGIWEIDAAALRVARKMRLGGPAIGMRLAADGKSLWVLQARALVRLDGERLRVVQTIRLPGMAEDFDVSPDGRAAISFREDRRVVLVRLQTSAIEHTVAVETRAVGSALPGRRQACAGGQPCGSQSDDLGHGQRADGGAAAAAGRAR